MAKRLNLNDFIAHVAGQSKNPGNQYVANTNADGTVAVSKNGAVLHPRVFYAGSGGAITDSNPTGDKVVIIDPNGIIGVGDAQVFLNSLK